VRKIKGSYIRQLLENIQEKFGIAGKKTTILDNGSTGSNFVKVFRLFGAKDLHTSASTTAKNYYEEY